MNSQQIIEILKAHLSVLTKELFNLKLCLWIWGMKSGISKQFLNKGH